MGNPRRGISLQAFENLSTTTQNGSVSMGRWNICGEIYPQMGPGSAWNGQWDQLALRQTRWSGGNGTNRTAPHKSSDILSPAGPSIGSGGARGYVYCLGDLIPGKCESSPEG